MVDNFHQRFLPNNARALKEMSDKDFEIKVVDVKVS